MKNIHVAEGDDLGSLLRTHRKPETVFKLGKGVFEVPGNWAFPPSPDNREPWVALASGCELIGHGPEQTTIRLSRTASRQIPQPPNGVLRDHPDRSLNPLWVGRGCIVQGIHIDGNEQAFRHDDPEKTWYVSSGLRSIGGQLEARDLKISGLRGTYEFIPDGERADGIRPSERIEAFGISTTDDTVGGSIIENVEFTDIPENAYFSGIFIGQMPAAGAPGTPPRTSRVRGIKIHVGTRNWFAISGAVGVEFDDVVSRGPRIGIYNDTQVSSGIAVRNLICHDVIKAVSLVVKPSDLTEKVGFDIRGSRFLYAPLGDAELGKARWALELWDQSGPEVHAPPALGGVHFRGCRFEAPAGIEEFYVMAVAARNIRGCTFEDCDLPRRILWHPQRPGPELLAWRKNRGPDSAPLA